MDFSNYKNSLNIIIERLEIIKGSIKTEESTKTSLVLPVFQALGYDIFNPLEFTPEYIADIGIKKGEKVDYAIIENGNPTILIEVKSIDKSLQKHDSQLFRYFGTSNAKIGILTNGDEYRFFTDLDEPNKMDSIPFLSFCLSTIEEGHITELSKFHKDNFDITSISKSALDLKYLGLIKHFLQSEFNIPSEELVSIILNSFYEGRKTSSIIEKFTPMVKRGMRQFITDEVNNKLSAALNSSVRQSEENDLTEKSTELTEKTKDDIVTTEEEIAAYTIAKLILKDSLDLNRVFYRDNRSYFNVLIDDNNRKWVFRLYVNNIRKFIVFNDSEKTELEIMDTIDIYKHKDKIIEVANKLINIV
ncbi:endonuclease [Listeria monocytogenes]|nr:endonuclease [Listeria monocytogenes]